MSIEQSRGKARLRIPRSKALRTRGTARVPDGSRDAGGRFLAGNAAAKNRGAKRVLVHALAEDGLQGEAAIVAADTRKLLAGTVHDLNVGDGTIVRTNAYGFARESALAAYYDRKANEAGLDSQHGIMLADRAAAHRKLAQSLPSVVCIDEARALEVSKPPPDFSRFAIRHARPVNDAETDATIYREQGDELSPHDEAADSRDAMEPPMDEGDSSTGNTDADDGSVSASIPSPQSVATTIDPRDLVARQLGVELQNTTDALKRAREAEEEKQHEREQVRRWERMR